MKLKFKKLSAFLPSQVFAGAVLLLLLSLSFCSKNNPYIPESKEFSLIGDSLSEIPLNDTTTIRFNTSFIGRVDSLKKLTYVEVVFVDPSRKSMLVVFDSRQINQAVLEVPANQTSVSKTLRIQSLPLSYEIRPFFEDLDSIHEVKVFIQHTSVEAGEPNEEAQLSPLLHFGVTDSLRIFPKQDIDFFRIHIPRDTLVQFDFSNIPNDLLLQVELYTDSLQELPGYQATQTLKEFNIPLKLTKGNYFLKVSSRFELSSTQFFKIQLQEYLKDLSEPNESELAAVPVQLNQDIQGTLFPKGDQDFYKLEIPEPGRFSLDILDSLSSFAYQVRLYHQEKDLGLEMISANPRYLQQDSLVPGTYFLQIKAQSFQSSDAQNQYKLRISKVSKP